MPTHLRWLGVSPSKKVPNKTKNGKEIKQLAYSLVSKPIRIQVSPKNPVAKTVDHSIAFVEMDDKKGEAITLNNLGSAYMENQQYEAAINFLLNSIEKSKAISFKPLESHNYWLINKAYSDNGNYKKANEYALLLNSINDSLLNESKVKTIAELETRYQTEKKEQEISE